MNPINDETPTKDSNDVNKIIVLDKSRELPNTNTEISQAELIATENSEYIFHQENDVNKIVNEGEKDELLNVQKNKGEGLGYSMSDNKNPSNSNNTINDNSFESEVCEEGASEKKIDDPEKQPDSLLTVGDMKVNVENHRTIEDTNENTRFPLEQVSDEEEEEVEEYEDVEIPEEEVDEIIVPDDAEAEDLTDDKDNEDMTDKSQHDFGEDEEEGDSKESDVEENEIDRSFHGEETSKSSHTAEKDDDSDKKSLNNDSQDTSPKDYEDEDNENSPSEPELVSLEHNIKDAESILEQPKSNESSIDEDSTSQATFDPLNYTGNKDKDDEDEGAERVKNVEEENTGGSQLSENDASETPCEEEDDEVQFVETRNSPICIESDDDDGNSENTKTCNNNKNENSKQILTTTAAIETVPQNIIITRTSARKSTAKPQQNVVPGNNSPTAKHHMQNKSRNLNYLQKAQIKTNNSKRSFTSRPTQHIVDCIDLLDSSDEESTSSRNRPAQQQKTPQKRTLLAAKGNYYKNNNKTTSFGTNHLPNKLPTHIRQQPKKPAPPPLPPPTPQSNFLNAVQLQPTAVSGQNPPAFSALLSNKNVIIPNAFYGNPPNFRPSPEMELERRYVRWLENFMNQFSKPIFVATHSCLVFLQRALKYKDFVRIKSLRANMNNHAHSTSNQTNNELITELKTIFLKNTRKITYYGRRFCELTCSAMPGKAVALMAHGISGKVTIKTCNMDMPKSANPAVSSTLSSSSPNPSTNTLTRKRQLDEDEDEYTPDKSKNNKSKAKPPSENGDEDSSEMGDDRKRSLRTKRTKRLDNSFSYNEDDLLAEYEIEDEDDEKLVHMEIQRKIEQKRLEAQKQRQQQVKSFESEFIQAFAKIVDEPTTSSKNTRNASMQRVRLKNSSTATVTSIRQYTANNDAEDLLQATWIENVENDDTQIISDDDEPKVHRIYKQQQFQPEQEHYSSPTKMSNRQNTEPSTNFSGRASRRNQEEIITGDDVCEENIYYANNPSNIDPIYWPKNVDPQMYVNGKHKDRCIICNLTCQRLVHHYVNEHRGCEVYNSRLSSTQIRLIKEGYCTGSNVSLYKNGQYQYEAYCIFCQKKSRFMFPYWYQHFTMHTGEYAYRCTGCGMRKPTRSLLTQHQTQGCPEEGGVVQDYAHDSRSMQIEAKMCSLCNYVQLHRSNIVKHLHSQHNIKQNLPKHIQTIVLMKTSPPLSSLSSAAPGPNRRSRPSTSYTPNTYSIGDDDQDVTYEEIIPEETQPQLNSENNYYNYIPPYMQAAVNSGNFSFENVDAGDDLSFMICGMLDVQMNPEAN